MKKKNKSTIVGGIIKKQNDPQRADMTKMKVYGLDAFQEHADDEVMQLNSKNKENWLQRRFKAHNPTADTR